MHNKDKEQVLELFRSIESNMKWLEGAFRFQFLENADSVERQIKNSPQSKVSEIIDLMIKTPFRRALGKVRGMLVSVQQCILLLSKE